MIRINSDILYYLLFFQNFILNYIIYKINLIVCNCNIKLMFNKMKQSQYYLLVLNYIKTITVNIIIYCSSKIYFKLQIYYLY